MIVFLAYGWPIFTEQVGDDNHFLVKFQSKIVTHYQILKVNSELFSK